MLESVREINAGHINKQLTIHNLAKEREIGNERDGLNYFNH